MLIILATGHYVRVDNHPVTGKRRLRRAVDPDKDQSERLARTCNQYRYASTRSVSLWEIIPSTRYAQWLAEWRN